MQVQHFPVTKLPCIRDMSASSLPVMLSHLEFSDWQGKYYEAICQDIDPKNKTIVACFPKDTGLEEACFRIPYDILIVGELIQLALSQLARALPHTRHW